MDTGRHSLLRQNAHAPQLRELALVAFLFLPSLLDYTLAACIPGSQDAGELGTESCHHLRARREDLYPLVRVLHGSSVMITNT